MHAPIRQVHAQAPSTAHPQVANCRPWCNQRRSLDISNPFVSCVYSLFCALSAQQIASLIMIKSMNEAINGTKPFSSVSVWFDRLTANNFKEDDYEGIPELVESINLQASGPGEASRCIRKKLKYGSVHGQKRALTILGALVENAGPRFQTSFADERLVQQIKLTAADPLVDASVRRKLMRLLLSWQQTYSKEPTMRAVSGLYVACGGGREKAQREAQRKRSEAEEVYRKQEEERKRDMQIRMDRKTAERLQKEEDKKGKKAGKGGAAAQQRKRFDYEKEKPAILNHLAVSSRSASNLVNALQHINREKENVAANTKVQQTLAAVKNERKVLVRYIQLCQDEEMVGALIEANERIMIALQLYDKLAKPTTSDSEDDEPLAAIHSNRATAEQRAAAEDAEIEAVRQRLAAADVTEGEADRQARRVAADDDDWEGEIEKLQFKQRRGIHRHNSRVGSFNPASSSGGGGAMQDLLDLDFDDTTSTSGPSLRPHNRLSTDTSSHSHSQPSSRRVVSGNLSDFSDYDSSDEEDHNRQQQQSSSSSQFQDSANNNHGLDLENYRKSQNNKFRIGEETSSLWSKEDEDRWIRGEDDQQEEEDDDPFGDEWEEVAGKLRASGAEAGREQYAVV
ncbi:unnamed protein product [Sympodiomycopsis kandeliae]